MAMPIRPIEGGVAPASTLGKSNGGTSSFQQALHGALDRADQTLQSAEKSVSDTLSGQVQNPHEVMIRLEQANLMVQWTLQVRNKVVEAYNDIMRIPM